MDLLQESRYKDTPVYLFFENYVLDVIGYLPQEKREILQGLELQKVFATQSHAWKDVIREVLKLSSTIDIAVLYQWYLAKEKAEFAQTEINPAQFSKNFVDDYFAENSIIDIWDEESLNEAKTVILHHRKRKEAEAS